MSSKQIAFAAVNGHRVTFAIAGEENVVGYVVGQDDYHWLCAQPKANLDVNSVLVHKGSAATITISPHPTLTNEDPTVRSEVERVGSAFWDYCKRTYFGSNSPRQEKTA